MRTDKNYSFIFHQDALKQALPTIKEVQGLKEDASIDLKTPTNDSATKLRHYYGCLLGLAVGDALGTTLEFKQPGTFKPIKDIVGGGPFKLLPGQWTDDTSMALCLAESLIESKGFNPKDQLEKYLKWYEEGYLSSTGKCFDIGNTTISALLEFKETQQPYCSSPNSTPSNGSLMRLAPIPMLYHNAPVEAIEKAKQSSLTTHGAKESIDACRYLAGLIVGAIDGVSKDELLSDHYAPAKDIWEKDPLIDTVDKIASGSFKHKEPPYIRGTGLAVESLEAALWAFYKASSFAEGALLAVNLGDDADTTGAIYGQLAGAFYGVEGIPTEWLNKLCKKDLIESLALEIYKTTFSENNNLN